MANYIIYKDGEEFNRIVADEAFCQQYYSGNGYSYELIPAHLTIIKIEPNDNGSHDNQTIDGASPKTFPIPEGYAVIPESVGTPDTLGNFPFGDITVEDIDGIPTVTGWTPGVAPEPEPEPEPGPTEQERLEAQVTYTAIMTDTLLEV